MADDPTNDLPAFAEQGSPTLQMLVDYGVQTLLAPENLKKIETTFANGISTGGGVLDAALTKVIEPIVRELAAPMMVAIAKTLFTVLDTAAPVSDDLAKLALDAVLGKGIARAGVAGDVGHIILQKLAPATATVEPSLEPAAGFMSTMVNLQMETWLMGLVAELFGDALDMYRGAGITIKSIGELREVVTQVFGGGRLTRRVLAPLIDDSIVAPAKRYTMQTYRPTLLSEASAVRQMLRGRWTEERTRTELAQLGWSDERIDAHLNEQRKFLGAGDVRVLLDRNHWTGDQALQHLKDQGWDDATAQDVLRLEGLRIFQAHEAVEAERIIAAYETRDIDQPTFLSLLQTYVSVDTTRALFEELGELRHQLHIKHLSSTQVAAAIKAGVLAYVDYREALDREGYDPAAIDALELTLRFENDKKHTLAEHAAQQAELKAADKAKRDAAAAAKLAQVEADRALKREGSFAELTRAAVLGLIPFTRVEQILTPQYDPDTVSILMGVVAQQRQDLLDKQAKAAEAAKRAQAKALNVSELQALYYNNLISLEDVHARLSAAGLTSDDAALLAQLTADTKKDRDAAAAKRADAIAKAAAKDIDLARLERLVRLGARPMSDYDAQLAELGYDDSARAAMVDLLNLEIAKDRKADQAKADAAAKLKNKGLSDADFRRAVILGHKTTDQYNTFLVTQGFTADAVATLVADLRAAVTDAEAARARRAQADARRSEPALALSTLVRAASLGIITPDVYQARLAADGYSADDIAIDMELLQVEIDTVTAQRAKRDLLEAQSGDRGIALALLAKAVKAGAASIEEYRSRATSLNYSADDVQTLVDLLQSELDAKAAAAARKAQIAPTDSAAATAIADLEASVRAGSATLDDYRAALAKLGLTPADVELLAGALADDVGSPSPPGA